MTFANFSAHVVNPIASGPAPAAAAATASTDGEGGFSFHDLLDIVNPLQHLPVVGTLYRAFTGDTIKTFPKIAGDTLYGGLEGLASSVADTIFTKLTGKSAGDTMLAFVENMLAPSKPDTAVASAPQAAAPPAAALALQALPAPLSLAQQTPVAAAPALDPIAVPGQDALLAALGRNGVSRDVALRAADAYRRTLSATASLH